MLDIQIYKTLTWIKEYHNRQQQTTLNKTKAPTPTWDQPISTKPRPHLKTTMATISNRSETLSLNQELTQTDQHQESIAMVCTPQEDHSVPSPTEHLRASSGQEHSKPSCTSPTSSAWSTAHATTPTEGLVCQLLEPGAWSKPTKERNSQFCRAVRTQPTAASVDNSMVSR